VRQTRGLTQKKVNGKTLDALDRPKSNEISTDISYYGLLRRLIRTDRRPQPCGKHGFIYRTSRNTVLEPRRQPLRLGPFG
jgi:hypothetical protein